jgi:hypothetical protein
MVALPFATVMSVAAFRSVVKRLVTLGGAKELEQSLLLVAHVRHVTVIVEVIEVIVLPTASRWRMHRDPRQLLMRRL